MNSPEHDEENAIHQNINNENESFSDAESFHSSDFSDHTEDCDDINPNGSKRQHDLSGTEGASSLMNLFSPEPLPSMTSPAKSVNSHVSNSSKSSFYLSQPVLERMITERRSNGTSREKISEHLDWVECLNDTTPLLSPPRTRLTHNASKTMHSVFESDKRCGNNFPCKTKCPSISRETIKNTVVGSITAVIFQIVYCIAMSSAIHRPYSNRAVLGQMVRLAAIGPLLGGPIFLYILGGTYPALYPMLDVFPAPFFYSMAAIVDQDLVEIGKADDDILFLNTFCLLSSMSLILTGALIVIGTKIKIANLASFLPYPVMSGFFTAIGFLCWTLSFSVDTSGKNVWSVLFSGNLHLILTCMKHHIGSLITGSLLSVFGKRNSLYIPLLLILPSVILYSNMSLRKMTLEQARNDGWFWHETDFKVYDTVGTSKFFVTLSWRHLFEKWTCPLPFGLILGIVQGRVHYKSVIRGLPTVISMAIIYFIRCAVHAPALQKSARDLAQWQQERENTLKSTSNGSVKKSHTRAMSQYDASFDFLETEDEHDIFDSSSNKLASTNVSNVLYNYGKILSFSGILNGFTVLPTIGSSVALFKMGAGDLPPQIGSLVLLGVFYLTQFDIVGYIPKMTFSALVSQCAIEMISTFGVSSWKKTAVKSEWMVIPVIVVCSFIYGVLQAVALGLGMSTFIFVAHFYRSGVVKFVSSGLRVHSTTERTQEDAEWLDLNGDLIQLLVLQSYIFFGNASSCLTYVDSMFNDPPESDFPPCPKPKYLIIDMSLVSSMDTSAVDIFATIIQRCYSEKCQVYISGLSSRLKNILKLGGVSPVREKKGSPFSVLRYPPSMEAALSKAEDGILKTENLVEETERIRTMSRSRVKTSESGFLYALRQIDSQHGLGVASTLNKLEKFTEVVELKAGESLFHHPDGTYQERSNMCGLYFIEYGQMRVERNANQSTTRGSLASWGKSPSYMAPTSQSNNSLSHLNARELKNDMALNLISNDFRPEAEGRTVRLARLKAGSVIGTVEACSHFRNQGLHIAMSPMRLHFLSQQSIEHLEEVDPKLILELFKMTAFLSAKRQEASIHQLTTLHTIMSSVGPSKPVDRRTIGLLKSLISNRPIYNVDR